MAVSSTEATATGAGGKGQASKVRGTGSIDLAMSRALQEEGTRTLPDTGRRATVSEGKGATSANTALAAKSEVGGGNEVAMDEGGAFNLIPTLPLSNIGAPPSGARGARRAGRGRLLPYSSASYRSMIAIKEVVDEAAGWTTPELSGTRLLTKNRTKKIGEVLFQVNLPKDGEQDEDEDDGDGLALDVSLTVVNALMFVSVLAGWKGVWDLQDVLMVPPIVSIWTGIVLFVARLKLESFLEVQNDWTQWLKEVGSMGQLRMGPVNRHLQMVMSGFLSFTSTVCVWRGVWTALDNTSISWNVCLCTAALSYAALSVLQGRLSGGRPRDESGSGDAKAGEGGREEETSSSRIMATDEFSRPEFTLSPEPRKS